MAAPVTEQFRPMTWDFPAANANDALLNRTRSWPPPSAGRGRRPVGALRVTDHEPVPLGKLPRRRPISHQARRVQARAPRTYRAVDKPHQAPERGHAPTRRRWRTGVARVRGCSTELVSRRRERAPRRPCRRPHRYRPGRSTSRRWLNGCRVGARPSAATVWNRDCHLCWLACWSRCG
jgi:hypothetical protein